MSNVGREQQLNVSLNIHVLVDHVIILIPMRDSEARVIGGSLV